MTKVLCDAEKCVHNVDWVCGLDKIRMKKTYYEQSRTYGYTTVDCREYKEKKEDD